MTGRLLTNTTSLQLEGAGVGVGLYPGYAMGNHACRWDRWPSELCTYYQLLKPLPLQAQCEDSGGG